MSIDSNPNSSDLLQEANAAYRQGHLAEARMIVETVIASEPTNTGAADLFARVVADQAKAMPVGGTVGSFWNRQVISSSTLGSLCLGAVLICIGVTDAYPALQAGFSSGFSPHTTTVIYGKYGIYPRTVSIGSVLLHSLIITTVGIGAICVAFWGFRKRFKG